MVDILRTRKGERVHTPVLRHDDLCHSVYRIQGQRSGVAVERNDCAVRSKMLQCGNRGKRD